MSLRIIYGRAGSGKSSFCLSDIKEKVKKGGDIPLILIVPEQYSFQAEKKLVKELGSSGINNAQVLSIRRMAYRVLSEDGGIARRHVNSAGKAIIIYGIMEKLAKSLTVYRKAAAQQGFVNNISGIISELKRYNITDEMLGVAIEELVDNCQLADKLTDIKLIYSEFNRIVHEKYLDTDDDLTLLAEKLKDSKLFDGAYIWMDEFSGFTPQEFAVIEKLICKTESVSVVLCTDHLSSEGCDVSEIFYPVKHTATKLMKIAKDNNVYIEKPVLVQQKSEEFTKKNLELSHLEKNLFSENYSKYKDEPNSIKLNIAANMYAEIEEAAKDILYLCREKNMKYSEIAVAAGNLSTYQKMISVVFKEYGIPCFIDSKRNINGHPLVLLILSVFQIFTKSWSYEAVFRYLKTNLTEISRDEIDIIENYVLANGIRGNRWTSLDNWSFSLDGNYNYDLNSEENKQKLIAINETRNKITKPLVDFFDKAKGRKKAIEICTALFDFLCEIRVPDRIEDLIETFREKGEIELAKEYGSIWNTIMEVIDQVAESTGQETMGLDRFSKLLAVGFEGCDMGLIPAAIEQVQVGSTDRSKTQGIKAMYILGANDGVFPAAAREEGIITDRERQQLLDIGIELAQDTRSKTFEQQYITYTVLTAASEYIYISCPASDLDGKAYRESILFQEIKKLFPHIKKKSKMADAKEFTMPAAALPTFNEMTAAFRQKFEGSEIPKEWLNIYGWYNKNSEWQKKLSAMKNSFYYTSQVADLEKQSVAKLYGKNIFTSVSRLERYKSCAFSYYVEYGLKAKERKIYKLSAPDLGTFLHRVIDEFSEKVTESGMSWREIDDVWCTENISQIIDQLLNKMTGSILKSSQRYIYLTDRLKRVLTRAVMLVAEHVRRSAFNPVGYEVGFGVGNELPEVVIETASGGKVILNGRIDRIDNMTDGQQTYIRIVDYKSGNKAFRLSEVYYGLQLQLITYMDAAIEGSKKEDGNQVLPAAVLYFKIDDPMISGGRGKSEEEIEKDIMKQLKMKGLILADVKLIRDMDKDITGTSVIIPATINKDDTIGKNSSVATVKQFELIRRHAATLLAEIGDEIFQGNIKINPYRIDKNIFCSYCNYHSVCQFDTAMKDNNYNFMDNKSDDDVWQALNKKYGEEAESKDE